MVIGLLPSLVLQLASMVIRDIVLCPLNNRVPESSNPGRVELTNRVRASNFSGWR